MANAPVLETTRLRLRPYTEADIAELVRLLGVREVAATTLRIPHPYNEQDGKDFLALLLDHHRLWLAITLREGGRQVGGIGLTIDEPHQHAELGYWLGIESWGKGYATEAAQEMLRYGFQDLKLHRIFASHFKHNPASGRTQAVGEDELRAAGFAADLFRNVNTPEELTRAGRAENV